MQADICFRCHRQGHWARDCPLKSPNSDFPKIYCRCGHGLCEVRTAKNNRNYGRRYYVCPIKRGKRCKDFVKWCDEPVDASDLERPLYTYPTCTCGAGVCRKEKARSGPNDGRYFFACPIGEDHGACNFRLWEDTLLGTSNIAPVPPGSQRTLHDYWDWEGNPLNEININDLDKGGDSKRMRTGDSECFSAMAVSELPEGEDAVLKEASRERRDHTESSTPLNHVDFPEFEAAEDLEDINMINSVSWEDLEDKAQSIFRLSTPSRIHSRQREFQRQMSTAADVSFGGIFYPCPMGWLGRLVFCHPTLSLKFPQPKPFFCCIFPSFNAIVVPTQESNLDGLSGELNQLIISNPGQHVQISTGCHTEVSGDAVSTNISPSDERKPMTKAQRQKLVVLFVQKLLLLELESLNPLDYESMRKAAEATFDLLNNFSVDYKHFSEYVWEFINSISSLVEILNSSQNNLSPEEHIQHYEEEKVRHANIHDNFGKAKALLEALQQRSQSLREEAFRLKVMLQGIETQLTSSDLETKKMETHLGEINASMMEAEESLKIAAEQADTARKLSQEREAKQIAAKTALEKAKRELEK